MNKALFDLIRWEPELQHVFNDQVPSDDENYLELYFRYFDLFLGLKPVGELINSQLNHNHGERYLFFKNLRSEVENQIKQKVKKLNFKPRVKQYLEYYNFRSPEIELFLLVCIYCSSSGMISYPNLITLTEKLHFSHSFIYQFSEEHPFILDKVVSVENPSSFSNDSLYHRNFIRDPLIHKIFANISLSDSDYIKLIDHPLKNFFGIKHLPEFIDLQKWVSESTNVNETGENEELAEKPRTKKRTKNELIQDSLIQSLNGFTNNLEYLKSEADWIFKLMELKTIKYDKYSSSLSEEELQRVDVLQREINIKRKKSQIRIEKSLREGFVPKMFVLKNKYKLNDDEYLILLALIISKILQSNKNYLFKNGEASIGELLVLLSDDVIERFQKRAIFLKNAPLVYNNFITIVSSDKIEESVYEFDVIVDNSIAESILEKERMFQITDFIGAGRVEKPSITMDEVVLEGQDKQFIMSTITNHREQLDFRKNRYQNDIFGYGRALTFLLQGPSGTGKTMTAKAISNLVDKRLFTLNYNNYSENLTGYRNKDGLTQIFSEAEINDYILFFDEADQLLSAPSETLKLLLEKHTGIVIFATNMILGNIDPSIQRRIWHEIEYKNPGALLRKEIWNIHLKKLHFETDALDTKYLADKFDINGGLIKNAINAAISLAINNKGNKDISLTMQNLMDAAKEQLKKKLHLSRSHEEITPVRGLDFLKVPEKTKNQIIEIINYHRNMRIFFDDWDFEEVFPRNGSISVLLHGPSGTGKTLAAEIIAFETGRNVKNVNYAAITSKYVGETEKSLEDLFKHADSSSIIVINEGDALFTNRTSVHSSTDRYSNSEIDYLLKLVEESNKFLIVTTNLVDNIDEAFFRRFTYSIRFEKPNHSTRLELWNKLMPSKFPVDKKVDFELLSRKYEFSGAEIKNAILRTAGMILNKNKHDPVATMDIFTEVCDHIKKEKFEYKKSIGFLN